MRLRVRTIATPIVKPVFPTIVIAWLVAGAFKWLLGFHLLVDPTLWLQYKVGYVISSSVDAAVILWLLYRVRGPFKSEGSPEPLNIWGWFSRAVVAGFARLAVLLPLAYFVLPRTPPSEQTATHLMLLLIPSSVAAAIAIWLLYAPSRAEHLRAVFRLARRSQ
jgi:hypothetical protein